MKAGPRRLPAGAEPHTRGVHFRVWTPDHPSIRIVVERARGGSPLEIPLKREPGGYASVWVDGAAPGDRYRYRVAGELLADPASRFQPEGPLGPSEVIDPAAFRWTDKSWKGRPLRGAVVYEMHAGTFTPEGTWKAAQDKLPHLADLGVTVIELMPVADFAGRFGWGYDGVFPYAPTRLYGRPDDFRAFINRAHELGLAVVLDVVYNHLGPSGCVFRRFAAAYVSTRYRNEWGDPLNFDGPESEAVREHVIGNAGYWIDEYHLDGLRLDATQSIYDASKRHVIAEIARTVRRRGRGRATLLFSENEPQQSRMVRPIEDGGFGLDALWNDDFHHSAVVALTGRCEAYYRDHAGSPQEFISAARKGYLFQGQRYAWQKQSRGTSTSGLPPEAFILFTENHDQLANSGDGSRLHRRTSPGRHRAMTALLLLLPGTPMLFQGQEMNASSPFLYFADHNGELSRSVSKGRSEFLRQFPSLASPEMAACAPQPNDPSTFERCKLDWRELETHAGAVALHRDLLRLRRSEAAFRRQEPGSVEGAVVGPEAFLLRFAAAAPEDDRIVLVNFGRDIVAESFPEPLLAPPGRHKWRLRWSSEHPAYGGTGTAPVAEDGGWRVPGHAAVVLAPESLNDATVERRS